MIDVKPGDFALAVFIAPRLRVLAVEVVRVWVSVGGTIRCDIRGTEANGKPLRPGMSVDRRALLPLSALEMLSLPATDEKSAAVAPLAGAVAG